jgi:hypothetical protein
LDFHYSRLSFEDERRDTGTKNDCFPKKAVVKTKSKTIVMSVSASTSDGDVLQRRAQQELQEGLSMAQG